MSAHNKSQTGCLKGVGIGCLVILIVGGVSAFWVIRNADRLMRSGSAKLLTVGTAALFSAIELPTEERAEIQTVLGELSDRIKTGELSAKRGTDVVKAIVDGPLPVIVILRSFEVMAIAAANLAPPQEEHAKLTISRFNEGLIRGSIPVKTGWEVLKLVQAGENEWKSASEISAEEISRMVDMMQVAADQAGVDNALFPTDIAAEIRRTIEPGLALEP